MKKIKALKVLVLVLAAQSTYGAGGVKLLTNIGASSIANPAMQSVISAESVFYNPASVVFLDTENSIYFGGYFADIDYRIESGGSYVETTTPQLIPSFSYIHKKEKISYYMGIGMSGQGGVLSFDSNLPSIQKMDSTIIYGGLNFGIAYLYSDKMSFSLGGKATYSKTVTEGIVGLEKIDDSEESCGIAPEIGAYYRKNDKIDLSIKYLHRTQLDYGQSLAGLFSFGMGYRVGENQRINFGYNCILEEEEYSDTYEYSVSFEQKITSKTKVIIGYSYSDKGKNQDGIIDFTELSSHQIGIGGIYNINENLDLTVGVGKIKYESELSSISDIKLKSKRTEILIGAGLEMRF